MKNTIYGAGTLVHPSCPHGDGYWILDLDTKSPKTGHKRTVFHKSKFFKISED